MYNRTGRLALKAFYTSLSKDYPEVAALQGEKRIDALGEAMFFEEGGLICPRLAGPELDDLRALEISVVLRACGVPSDQQARLREIVRMELPILNDKRRWSLSL